MGDTTVDKLPSVLVEHAYRDTWGRGRESYLSMVYERLVMIHELLADDGSFYLHCAPNVSHYLKLICDEIFGTPNFRSEIVWKRTTAHSDTKQGRTLHGGIHEVILFYTKGSTWTWNSIYVPYDKTYIELKYRFVDQATGRRYRLDNLTAAKPGGDTSFEWHGRRPYKGRYWAYTREKLDQMLADGLIRFPDKPDGVPEFKRYLDEMPDVPLQDVWTDLDPINARGRSSASATRRRSRRASSIGSSRRRVTRAIWWPTCSAAQVPHSLSQRSPDGAGLAVISGAFRSTSRANAY